jgi:hypothetical protein
MCCTHLAKRLLLSSCQRHHQHSLVQVDRLAYFAPTPFFGKREASGSALQKKAVKTVEQKAEEEQKAGWAIPVFHAECYNVSFTAGSATCVLNNISPTKVLYAGFVLKCLMCDTALACSTKTVNAGMSGQPPRRTPDKSGSGLYN